MDMLLVVLKHDLILICKQKRKGKTTYECIEETLVNEKTTESNIMPLSIFVENKSESDHFQNAI
jgi:hypothetical protein